MSTVGGVARGSGAGQAEGVYRSGILGQTSAGIWRPECSCAGCRSCARRARLEPHGSSIHGRCVRRVFVSSVVPGQVRESAVGGITKRWSHPEGSVYHSCRPLRASIKQAEPQRIEKLPAVSRKGNPDLETQGDRMSGSDSF